MSGEEWEVVDCGPIGALEKELAAMKEQLREMEVKVD